MEASAIIHKASVAKLLIIQLRPRQWSKNLLVFGALLFSFRSVSFTDAWQTLAGFVAFCFTASMVYVINDFADRKADQFHPVKKHRPMASGALNPYLALLFGALLFLFSLFLSYKQTPTFTLLLLAYFFMNVGYSFGLKHMVIIDMMIIAAGFVMRAVAGGLIIRVPITPWFLICTMLLSLFLAVSKRRHELHLLQSGKGAHRKVLEHYSIAMLDQINAVVIAAAIISYSLFTFTSGRTIHLMWTIPLVIYGIFRYLYLIHIEDKGGSPERILFEDKPILITVLLYAAAVVFILGVVE